MSSLLLGPATFAVTRRCRVGPRVDRLLLGQDLCLDVVTGDEGARVATSKELTLNLWLDPPETTKGIHRCEGTHRCEYHGIVYGIDTHRRRLLASNGGLLLEWAVPDGLDVTEETCPLGSRLTVEIQ